MIRYLRVWEITDIDTWSGGIEKYLSFSQLSRVIELNKGENEQFLFFYLVYCNRLMNHN